MFNINVWDDLRKQKEEEGLDEEEIDDYIQSYAAAVVASAPPNAFKKVKKLPSYSEYTWEDAVCHYNLPPHAVQFPMRAFKWAPLPILRLPKELQVRLYQRGWEALDVYGELVDQENEACAVRTLESWLSLLSSRFYGRITNHPQVTMKGTEFSSGGSCEYDLQGFNGLWLTLLEVKQRLMGNIGNSLAQLMAQVAVAHAANKKFQHPQLTVYGVLTDQTMFYFISYDGIEFTGYPRLSLSPNKLQFLRGMMALSNVLFGFLLQAYIASLNALQKVSRRKEDDRDLSSGPSFPGAPTLEKADCDTTPRKKTSRPSLDRWNEAHGSALRAWKLLSHEEGASNALDSRSSEELDRSSREGMKCLAHSVEVIPRISCIGEAYAGSVSDLEILSTATETVDTFFRNGCKIWPTISG